VADITSWIQDLLDDYGGACAHDVLLGYIPKVSWNLSDASSPTQHSERWVQTSCTAFAAEAGIIVLFDQESLVPMEITSSASPTLSLNLANHPAEYRAALEAQKAEMFAFWQQNRERSYAEAGRIFSEKEKRKAGFRAWADAQIEALEPQQYRNMVRTELNRLVSGKPSTE